jgi:5'-methylthioadenosine phosphorylase
MTGHPEAVLARELALCYATVALVTDHDAGVDDGAGGHGEAVSMEAVFQVFREHTDTLKSTLATVVSTLGERDCACGSAVDGMTLPFELP